MSAALQIVTSLAGAGWRDAALCAQADIDLWFPERGNDAQANTACGICRSCPSRAECLAFALEHHAEGIWGGFSERARQRIGQRHRAGQSLQSIIAAADARHRARLEQQEQQVQDRKAARLARRRIKDRARYATQRSAAA